MFKTGSDKDLMEAFAINIGDPEELAAKMLEAAAPILRRQVEANLAKHERSGDLKKSLVTSRVKSVKTKGGSQGYIVTVHARGKDKKGVSNTDKLIWLEYGRYNRETGVKQVATPVLRPAVRQSEAACLAAMQHAFDEATK